MLEASESGSVWLGVTCAGVLAPCSFTCVQAIGELVNDGGVVFINDKKLMGPLRIKLHFVDHATMQH